MLPQLCHRQVGREQVLRRAVTVGGGNTRRRGWRVSEAALIPRVLSASTSLMAARRRCVWQAQGPSSHAAGKTNARGQGKINQLSNARAHRKGTRQALEHCEHVVEVERDVVRVRLVVAQKVHRHLPALRRVEVPVHPHKPQPVHAEERVAAGPIEGALGRVADVRERGAGHEARGGGGAGAGGGGALSGRLVHGGEVGGVGVG